MTQPEPRFLTRDQIERLHELSLLKFGGSSGIRDEGLIDSALASAKSAYYYGRGDLFEIAAAYAFHLAEAQAFLAANKRTAVGAAWTFLDLNGITKLPDDDRLYGAMIAVAKKQKGKTELAALVREAAGKEE